MSVGESTVSMSVNGRNKGEGNVKVLFEIAMRLLLAWFLIWFITLQFTGLRFP